MVSSVGVGSPSGLRHRHHGLAHTFVLLFPPTVFEEKRSETARSLSPYKQRAFVCSKYKEMFGNIEEACIV